MTETNIVSTKDAPVRGRSRRAVDLGERASAPQATEEMIDLAKEAYKANGLKNKETRTENAAKKTLAGLMARVEKMNFFTFRVGAKNIDVTYEPTKTESIDVSKLADLVGANHVLDIAKITKTDAINTFGTNVVDKCLVSGVGDHKVTVKERGKR